MRATCLALAFTLACAGQASAADARGPTLLQLAEVLGESHALRQACAGSDDQFWRSRMMRLLEVERPEPAFEQQLKAAFNQAFTERAGAACTPAVRRAEAAAAARGRALSSRLMVASAAEPR